MNKLAFPVGVAWCHVITLNYTAVERLSALNIAQIRKRDDGSFAKVPCDMPKNGVRRKIRGIYLGACEPLANHFSVLVDSWRRNCASHAAASMLCRIASKDLSPS
jgi:hypothetical protein